MRTACCPAQTQQLALSRVHTASDGAPSGLASSSGALPSVDMRAARSVVTAAGGDGDDRAMSALRASTSYGASAGVTGSMALPFRPQQRSGQYFVPGSEGERGERGRRGDVLPGGRGGVGGVVVPLRTAEQGRQGLVHLGVHLHSVVGCLPARHAGVVRA